MNGDPLAQLRDIHLPPPVGWWPPAPGWWLLALLALVTLLLGALWLRRRHRRSAYRRAALAELRQLQAIDDPLRFARAVNALLKRTALAAFPRRQVAPLYGADWLAFLDSRLRRPQFTEPSLRALGANHHPQPDALDRQLLTRATSHWIRRHK